jgi:hypothetical protein
MLFVMVGMVLGVGILTFDKFANAVKTPTTINDTVVMTAGVGTATYDEINSVSSAGTGTFLVTKFNDAGTDALNWTEAGVITMNTTVNGNIWVVYNYNADSKTTTELDNVRDAITTISNSWFSLIITVVVLAIILTMVIGSFGTFGGRK